MMQRPEPLADCPFCGSPYVVMNREYSSATYWYKPMCTICGATHEDGKQYWAEAVTRWNTRWKKEGE